MRELALLFLRLGATAFGGPAAHIALMRREAVTLRRWLTDEEFLDLLAAANLIPGPNSTELAMHIGCRRAGRAGLVVAGACFILPAALITLTAAAAYVRYRARPEVAWLAHGIAPVIVALVLQAVWQLGRTVVRRPPYVLMPLMTGAAALCALAGVHELSLLAGAGVLSAAWRGRPNLRASATALAAIAMLGVPAALAAAAAAAIVPVTLGRLTWFFAKVGSVLYGSGYVLIAFLRADLVERWRWLTERELLDVIAVGQVTPGPVFTTATFVGYLLAGLPGAICATAGIFLPAFVFVLVSYPLLPRIRRSATALAFLDGVVAASLGLMIAVIWQIAVVAVNDATSVALAGAALVILTATSINPAWLIAAGAVVGWLTRS